MRKTRIALAQMTVRGSCTVVIPIDFATIDANNHPAAMPSNMDVALACLQTLYPEPVGAHGYICRPKPGDEKRKRWESYWFSAGNEIDGVRRRAGFRAPEVPDRRHFFRLHRHGPLAAPQRRQAGKRATFHIVLNIRSINIAEIALAFNLGLRS